MCGGIIVVFAVGFCVVNMSKSFIYIFVNEFYRIIIGEEGIYN